MSPKLKAHLPRGLGKWALYAVMLLAPGSFVILPVMWLLRLCARKDYCHARDVARYCGISLGH
jgi:hypothetical protein